MKKTTRILALMLSLVMAASLCGLSVLAESANEFQIEKYVAFGDSIAAGLNSDEGQGDVPRVPTGELNDDGTPKQQEVFGTSPAGYTTQLARRLNLSGSGRVDTIRPDDGYRSWAYAGMRSRDVLSLVDPDFEPDLSNYYTGLILGHNDYESYQERIIRDTREADLITVEVGANDFFTDPVFTTMMEMQEEGASEEETLALQEAEEEMEEGEDAGSSLEKLTSTLETIGSLDRFLQRFLPKVAAGYQDLTVMYPRLIERLRAINPNAQIVLQGVPNPVRKMSLTNNGIVAIGQAVDALILPANALIAGTAAANGCDYVDILTVECDSSFHPSTAGYTEMMEKIVAKLRVVDPAGYRDVEKGSWYASGVDFVTKEGLMTGTGKRIFSPNDPVTRGAIAQILYAAEGKPSGAPDAGFRDVKKGMWYTDAVNFCVSAKLCAGYTDGTFRPDDPITRQQLAAILYQYAAYKGKDVSAIGDLSRYTDAGQIRDYAATPMQWAVGHRLLAGTGRGLEPNGTATRAQLAVILKAFWAL